ncbi:MAG: Gx transporter family protein [Massiliimalia sp.]
MYNNRSSAWQAALMGMLAALALALSWLERMIPLELFIPIPGLRLGFANIVGMFALFYLSPRMAFGVVMCRCGIQAMLFGTLSSFLFSSSGGILSFGVMLLLIRKGRNLSVFGVSMAGAAAHNLGQVLCAAGYFQSLSLLSYLSVLLILSIPVGLFTGFVARLVFSKLHIQPECPASRFLLQ